MIQWCVSYVSVAGGCFGQDAANGWVRQMEWRRRVEVGVVVLLLMLRERGMDDKRAANVRWSVVIRGEVMWGWQEKNTYIT